MRGEGEGRERARARLQEALPDRLLEVRRVLLVARGDLAAHGAEHLPLELPAVRLDELGGGLDVVRDAGGAAPRADRVQERREALLADGGDGLELPVGVRELPLRVPLLRRELRLLPLDLPQGQLVLLQPPLELLLQRGREREEERKARGAV